MFLKLFANKMSFKTTSFNIMHINKCVLVVFYVNEFTFKVLFIMGDKSVSADLPTREIIGIICQYLQQARIFLLR